MCAFVTFNRNFLETFGAFHLISLCLPFGRGSLILQICVVGIPLSISKALLSPSFCSLITPEVSRAVFQVHLHFVVRVVALGQLLLLY